MMLGLFVSRSRIRVSHLDAPLSPHDFCRHVRLLNLHMYLYIITYIRIHVVMASPNMCGVVQKCVCGSIILPRHPS